VLSEGLNEPLEMAILPDERVLVHIPSPNDPERCTVFWALAISPGFRGPAPASGGAW